VSFIESSDIKHYLRMFLKFHRNFEIQLTRIRLIKEKYPHPRDVKKLIIFLTPGVDAVNGGILSISSIFEETQKLKDIHNAETVMCTLPGDRPLLQYTKFKNRNYIYDFSQVLRYFKSLQSLMIHIPECYITNFVKHLGIRNYSRLVKIKEVHFNILLQNIALLSPINDIEKLKKIGKLTCTTAHKKYTTLELKEKLGCPIHWLSTYVSPEKYERRKFNEKEDLMVVSPDPTPRKTAIIRLITKNFPRLKVKIIRGTTYEEYKKMISKAKWALTFGEGLDNYFVETIFSGGIGFALYNPSFFTEDFKSLRTVYDSYDVLTQKICSDIRELNNEIKYTEYQNEQYNLCNKHYKREEYIKNLEQFYKGEYLYV